MLGSDLAREGTLMLIDQAQRLLPQFGGRFGNGPLIGFS